MLVKPSKGINARLPAYNVPIDNFIAMQNFDMKHSEDFEQIDGSMKYHGSSIGLGTSPPSAIMPYYNVDLNSFQVLVAVDDKIFRKNLGSNEMELIFSGITPNSIKFAENVNNNLFIGCPDGLIQYDGITAFLVNGGPKIKDIIFSKETNRCFAVSSEIPNAYIWTDDLTTTGASPVLWPARNADTVPSSYGEVIERIQFLEGRMVFFMTNSTWIEYVNGSPTNWRFEKSPTVVGWIAPKTIKQVRNEFWGLGFSTNTGRGLYAFNGRTSRLLSYDVEPILNRINEAKIKEACGEHVNNIYKLSFAIDSDIQNNTTLHFDTINVDPTTQNPNVYGPHTYGFNSSAVLNTKNFRGEHLFGSLYAGGSWVFKTASEYQTQHASGPVDDGDLIACIGLTGIISAETDSDKNSYDFSWMKRYSNLYVLYPPSGSWNAIVDILTDFKNQVYDSFTQWFDRPDVPLAGLNLGSDPLSLGQLRAKPQAMHILSQGIQLQISNYNVNSKFVFSGISYDARPVRRLKDPQNLYVA